MRSLYHKAIYFFTVLFQWHQWDFSIFSNSFTEVYLFIFSSGNNIWKSFFCCCCFLFVYFFIFFKFYFIFKLYNIVLVLPNIEMNPPQVYMCSPSWTLLPPSPHHPSGSWEDPRLNNEKTAEDDKMSGPPSRTRGDLRKWRMSFGQTCRPLKE